MALRELPSFSTNNVNAADVENGLSAVDSCVCVCACALVSQNQMYGKNTKKITRTLTKNNLKMSI
jgi:hypothetical protein